MTVTPIIVLRRSWQERKPPKSLQNYESWFNEYRNDVKKGSKGELCHTLICTFIWTLILICTVIVFWFYLIMNFMIILSTIKNLNCKEVAMGTGCFISDPLSYNIQDKVYFMCMQNFTMKLPRKRIL